MLLLNKLIWSKMLLTQSKTIVSKEDSLNHLFLKSIKEIFHLLMPEGYFTIELQAIEFQSQIEWIYLQTEFVDIEQQRRLSTPSTLSSQLYLSPKPIKPRWLMLTNSTTCQYSSHTDPQSLLQESATQYIAIDLIMIH